MEHSELETELVAEGKSFAARYPNLTGDKEFISKIAKAFNGDTLFDPVFEITEERLGAEVEFAEQGGALTHSDTAKHFGIMHGYLHSAYICGMAEDDEPEWADSRQSSWIRWVQYLRVVEAYPRDKAIAFAKRFFYAVDSVSAYS